MTVKFLHDASYSVALCLAALLFYMPSAMCKTSSGSIVTDPSISLRCKEILSLREKKLALRQKAQALIKRNKRLRKYAVSKRRSAINKLRENFNRLKQEEFLLNLKVKSIEENIVRSGCPGIIL